MKVPCEFSVDIKTLKCLKGLCPSRAEDFPRNDALFGAVSSSLCQLPNSMSPLIPGQGEAFIYID